MRDGGNAGFTFDPDIVLAAMQECITIVHPGEVLAVRVPPDLAGELQRLQEGAEDAGELYGVKILFVAGDEFAVIRAGNGRGLTPRPSGQAPYFLTTWNALVGLTIA